MSYYIAEVIEDDNGELLLEFPANLLNQMGWDEHTLLEWIIEEENDSVYIKEKTEET